MYSVICLKGSVLAMRSGMMKEQGELFLPSAEQHLRIGLFQRPAEGAIIDCDQFVLDREDHQAHRIAGGPAHEALHRVFGEHRRAVMELEAGTQLEGPDEAIAETSSLSTIWRCGCELRVDAVERVPDQRGGVAHDVLRAPDRIEVGEVGLRHEAQRLGACALRRVAGMARPPLAATSAAPPADFTKVLRSIFSVSNVLKS